MQDRAFRAHFLILDPADTETLPSGGVAGWGQPCPLSQGKILKNVPKSTFSPLSDSLGDNYPASLNVRITKDPMDVGISSITKKPEAWKGRMIFQVATFGVELRRSRLTVQCSSFQESDGTVGGLQES